MITAVLVLTAVLIPTALNLVVVELTANILFRRKKIGSGSRLVWLIPLVFPALYYLFAPLVVDGFPAEWLKANSKAMTPHGLGTLLAWVLGALYLERQRRKIGKEHVEP